MDLELTPPTSPHDTVTVTDPLLGITARTLTRHDPVPTHDRAIVELADPDVHEGAALRRGVVFEFDRHRAREAAWLMNAVKQQLLMNPKWNVGHYANGDDIETLFVERVDPTDSPRPINFSGDPLPPSDIGHEYRAWVRHVPTMVAMLRTLGYDIDPKVESVGDDPYAPPHPGESAPTHEERAELLDGTDPRLMGLDQHAEHVELLHPTLHATGRLTTHEGMLAVQTNGWTLPANDLADLYGIEERLDLEWKSTQHGWASWVVWMMSEFPRGPVPVPLATLLRSTLGKAPAEDEDVPF